MSSRPAGPRSCQQLARDAEDEDDRYLERELDMLERAVREQGELPAARARAARRLPLLGSGPVRPRAAGGRQAGRLEPPAARRLRPRRPLTGASSRRSARVRSSAANDCGRQTVSRGMKAAVVAMAVAGAFAVAGPAAAAPHVGAGRERADPSGRADDHRRRAVHGELRLLRRRRHLHRPGRALRRHRRGTDDERLRRRLAAARHAGRGHGASRPGTLAYSSWIAMQAQRRDRRGHVRSTTTWRSSGSTRPTTARSTRRSRSGAARPGSPTRSRARREGALLRQLLAARRHHAAEPEGGRLARPGRRRLDPLRVHRLAGHPG